MEQSKWSLRTIILYGINSLIGSGIFLLPGAAYNALGPSSLLAYFFVIILVMSIALCFAECGSMFKESGGPYLYARKAFDDFFGYEVGIMKWIVSIIAWSTMAAAFATAISILIPELASPHSQKIVSISIILILSFVNLFGVNIMAYLNNIATIGKLIPMILFISIGIFFSDINNFQPFFPENITLNATSTAIILVFYAFTGFENLGVAAGDMQNPTKNVPRALISSILIVSIIYFLIQLLCIGILGKELSNTITPVATAMGAFAGTKGILLVTIGTLVSIGGLNIAGSFNTPRCAQSLSDGGLLPKVFSKCNRYNVPYISVMITCLLAILITLTGSFTELAAISVISRFSQYIPTCLAVPVLRKKHPEMLRSYSIPYGNLLPTIAIISSLWLLSNTDPFKLMAGLGAMLLVAPLYFLIKKQNKIN